MKGVVEKLEKLVEWHSRYKGALVSFSGGVDSSVVAYAAKRALGDKAIAVMFLTPTFPDVSVEWARSVASEIGIKLHFENIQLPKLFYKNPINRCYICKETMSKSLVYLKNRFKAEVIVDGYQKDDLRDFTPGRGATVRYGIRSPLLELGFGKEDVRAIARHAKLSVAERPANPCLATRIPFGHMITSEKLYRIANAERVIKELTGVKVVRVRDHAGLARVEVGREERSLFFDEELLDIVHRELIKLGYDHVSLDMIGYRRGSVSKPRAPYHR
jgi:uncharacterized protein